jgi:hypothetical protein
VALAFVVKWDERLKLSVPCWTISRMKTKWCSRVWESRRFWLKVEPASKWLGYREYVVVREMTTHLERGPVDCYTKLVGDSPSAWRSPRNVLNKAPLAEEPWE